MQTRRILLRNRRIQLQKRRIQLQNRRIQLQTGRIQLQYRRIQLQYRRIQLQTGRIQLQRRRIQLQKPVNLRYKLPQTCLHIVWLADYISTCLQMLSHVWLPSKYGMKQAHREAIVPRQHGGIKKADSNKTGMT